MCEVIRVTLKNSFKIGWQACQFIFNASIEFYKTASPDPQLAYPIGKNRNLPQYNPLVG